MASIGNNLNQVARRVNTAEWGPSDRVAVIGAPSAGIERELAELVTLHK